MDYAKDAIASLRAGPVAPSTLVLGPILLLGVLILFFRGPAGSSDEPMSLPSWKGIPVLGNTLEYIIDNASFISRAR